MSERTLKQLVGALAVVVGVWLVSLLFGSGSGSIGAGGEIGGFFDGLDASAIEAIRLDYRDASVELTRESDMWTANGYPGDQVAVSRFLEALGGAQVGDLVASNPDNHTRMGVSADSATSVTFDVGGASRTILIGNSGRRYGTAYVRLPDSDDVYLLDGDLRVHATRRLENWRNRWMVALDSTQVARIEVARPGDTYAVVRGDSVWTMEGGGEPSPTVVNGILTELSSLLATSFFEEGDSIAGLELATTTTAYSAAGEVLAEITIGAGVADRWARTASDDYIYRVSSFRAGRVAPSRETILPDGP